MTEDFGELLAEEWGKHPNWDALGRLVSARLVQSYQSGFKEGGRASGIKALERLLEGLKS